MQKMDPAFKCDINIVCKGRLLFNYSTKLGYYNEGTEEKGIEYSDSIINETINLNLIHHKTLEFFEEWNLFSYSTVFKFIKSERKLKKFKKDINSATIFSYTIDKVWLYINKMMEKRMYYTDSYYVSGIKKKFGYEGFLSSSFFTAR